MFTTADETGADGHYGDLIQTIGFLQNDPVRTQAFERALPSTGRNCFGSAWTTASAEARKTKLQACFVA